MGIGTRLGFLGGAIGAIVGFWVMLHPHPKACPKTPAPNGKNSGAVGASIGHCYVSSIWHTVEPVVVYAAIGAGLGLVLGLLFAGLVALVRGLRRS